MKLYSSLGRCVAIIIALVVPSASWADQCGKISPLLDKIGDEYYLLLEISNLELQNSSTVYNNVVRKISNNQYTQGDGSRTRCLGTSELREETSKFILEEITPPALNAFNEVVIEALETDDNDILNRREMVIPLSEHYAAIQGEDTLLTNVRHRQSGLADSDSTTSNLREVIFEVAEVGSGIKIKQLLYVNGYLAEWTFWNLR